MNPSNRMFQYCLIATLILASCTSHTPQLDAAAELDYCVEQVYRTLSQLRRSDGTIDYTMMPRNIAPDDSVWHQRKVSEKEWCGGFWPGILWYAYEHSGDSALRGEAERFTESLAFLAHTPAYDHDLGFLIYCSYGNGYRLTRREDYKQVILDVADTLGTLYNPTVGTILSWPRHVSDYGGHNTIMDNMMNLEMLYFAAEEQEPDHTAYGDVNNNGADANCRLSDIATTHAATTMRHHFRDDGGCYHVAVYDTTTGDFLRGCTHQGYSDSSLWARGQAWAIYGYTVVYRATGDTTYLRFAEKVTDLYLSRLPDDGIPYWDFDDPTLPHCTRDASAAAIVASALLELCGYVAPNKGSYYRAQAEHMLSSLSSSAYRSGDAKPSMLLHATGHRPNGSEVDYSIIYADYYYIEALHRLKQLQQK